MIGLAIRNQEDKVKSFNKYINAVMAFLENIIEKINNIGFLNINPGKKTLAIVFSAAVVLIAAVSGVFIIGEITQEDPTMPSDGGETTQEITSFVSDAQELRGNFLIALTYDDKISLLGVIRADSAEKSVKVSFVSGDTYCSFNNLSGTMNDHYKNGGITELVWAVGEYANISIERYLLADEGTFTDLLERIGEMSVNLEHDVVCGQDAASFIIEEGQQNLIPAMMAKYFYYICDNQDKYREEVIDVMSLYAKNLFCTEDGEKAKSNFSYMISCIETNISALDFNNYKAPILALADPQILDNIAIEEDTSSLR